MDRAGYNPKENPAGTLLQFIGACNMWSTRLENWLSPHLLERRRGSLFHLNGSGNENNLKSLILKEKDSYAMESDHNLKSWMLKERDSNAMGINQKTKASEPTIMYPSINIGLKKTKIEVRIHEWLCQVKSTNFNKCIRDSWSSLKFN